ncbi:MAG: PPC domain-containing protein [Chloroflexi bacterium]|nr:PPC domain-containing protein [Chloroflexota bacterium]
MGHAGRYLILSAGLAAMLLALPAFAQGVPPPIVLNDVCPEPNDGAAQACSLGRGAVVQGLFQTPTDQDAYRLEVPAGGAQVHLTLTDLWHPSDMRLFDATGLRQIDSSDRSGIAQGQLEAPEIIVDRLEQGTYIVVVRTLAPETYPGAEAHSYTLRAELAPANTAPPVTAGGYSLSLNIEPGTPNQFSLMTFTAYLDPPFSDLFDFAWEVDGQRLGDAWGPVAQLPRPDVGSHSIRVTAIGARQYPDRTLPHMPPTLSASGTFQVTAVR